jgi:hypothetical protein
MWVFMSGETMLYIIGIVLFCLFWEEIGKIVVFIVGGLVAIFIFWWICYFTVTYGFKLVKWVFKKINN